MSGAAAACKDRLQDPEGTRQKVRGFSRCARAAQLYQPTSTNKK